MSSEPEMPLDYRLWLDRQLYGNSYERISRVPCEPCQQIGECLKCKNTRFVEVRERIHPMDVVTIKHPVAAASLDDAMKPMFTATPAPSSENDIRHTKPASPPSA